MQENNPFRFARRNPNDHSEASSSMGQPIKIESHDLKNTRDLRTFLVEAAFQLMGQPDRTDAHIYLYNCTLARKRVEWEVEQFKRITQLYIAQHIHLHDDRAKAQQSDRSASDAPLPVSAPSREPTAASQEAVITYLMRRYIESLDGANISTIASETGASLPTIYKALKTYGHCIVKDPEDKTLRLGQFSQSDWLYWIQRTNRLSSVYFIDRSGAPRSATRLARELRRLKRKDLAIGGLMGALHHLPALDATSSPQLDILVHGNRRSDLSFITEIDPGLELYTGRTEKADVVVHFIDRPASLFVSEDGQTWGSLPDCLANLQKAGFAHQFNDALQLMEQGQSK